MCVLCVVRSGDAGEHEQVRAERSVRLRAAAAVLPRPKLPSIPEAHALRRRPAHHHAHGTSPPRSRYVTITLTGVDPFTLPLTVRRHHVRDSSLTSGESRSWYITTMLVVHHRHAQVHSTSPPC